MGREAPELSGDAALLVAKGGSSTGSRTALCGPQGTLWGPRTWLRLVRLWGDVAGDKGTSKQRQCCGESITLGAGGREGQKGVPIRIELDGSEGHFTRFIT